MKKTVAAVLAAIAAPYAVAQYQADAGRLSVIAAIKNESAQVKDALWTSATRLKVGVLDDGTPRHGFAMYICNYVTEIGISGTAVDVIDIAKLVQTNKWHVLGAAQCK